MSIIEWALKLKVILQLGQLLKFYYYSVYSFFLVASQSCFSLLCDIYLACWCFHWVKMLLIWSLDFILSKFKLISGRERTLVQQEGTVSIAGLTPLCSHCCIITWRWYFDYNILPYMYKKCMVVLSFTNTSLI